MSCVQYKDLSSVWGIGNLVDALGAVLNTTFLFIDKVYDFKKKYFENQKNDFKKFNTSRKEKEEKNKNKTVIKFNDNSEKIKVHKCTLEDIEDPEMKQLFRKLYEKTDGSEKGLSDNDIKITELKFKIKI